MRGGQDGRRHSRAAAVVIACAMHGHSSETKWHEAREHTQAAEQSGDRHIIAMHMCKSRHLHAHIYCIGFHRRHVHCMWDECAGDKIAGDTHHLQRW